MADGDIKPLGFAIDTSALEAGAKAAEAFASNAKGMGGAVGDANKNLGDLGKAASDSTKAVEDAAKAAEKLAEANKKVAESADAAKKAQTELANAPVKPVPAPNPGQPAQGANGGWYADQATADWANGLAAKRAKEQEDQAARMKAAKDRMAEAAEPIKDVEEAAKGADAAIGGFASRMSLGAVVAGAMGAVVGGAVVTGLFAAGRAAMQAADDTERYERRLLAITGAADGATRALQGMKDAANASGGLKGDQMGLQEGLLGADGLGLSPDEISRFGSTSAQISSISGNKAADFGRIGSTISSSLQDGVVSLAELNRMLDDSPALIGALTAAFDMPIDRVRKLASEGGLFSDDFVRRLNDVSAATDKTFDSLGSSAEDGWRRATDAGSRFFDTLIGGEAVAQLSSELADTLAAGFDDAEKKIRANGFWNWIFFNGPSPAQASASRAAETQAQWAASERYYEQQGWQAPKPSLDDIPASQPTFTAPAAGRRPSLDDIPASELPAGFAAMANAGSYQERAAALGKEITGAIPNARLGSGYRTPEEQARLVKELPGIAVANSRHPTGGAYDFQVPGMGQRDLPRVRQMLQSGGVQFEDLLYHNNHFHVERAAEGDGGGRGQLGAVTNLLSSGSSATVARVQNELDMLRAEKQRNPSDPSVDVRIAEKQNELRSAQAQQDALSRTPVSRARESLSDRQRAAAFGGGGAQIASQAYASARAAREQGYDASDQDYLNLGIGGAVLGANAQVERAARQASAAEAGAATAGRGKLAAEQERIGQQVSDFRFQNFGSLEGEGIEKAVDSYREALERLAKAQRDTANAQELLNAKTEAGVSDAEAAALAGGKRGYAVDLARQEAEEAALAKDGRSVDASRTRFDARNRSRSANAAASETDSANADARYMGIGSDAYSRREYGRGEQIEQAGKDFDGGDRQAALRAQFAREDARLAKDRADADAESVHAAERQLSVAGKVGAERRAAQAILERENELVAQGLLGSTEKLSEEEAKSVVANAERLRLIQQQVEEMDRFASVAKDTSGAVGGGLRSLASDFFADARVESDKLLSTVQGMVARIGTSIADGLIIKPIERATEKVSEMAVDWIGDAIGGIMGKGGGKGGDSDKASAAASVGKEAASAAGKVAADTKATVAATAKGAADTKAMIATQAASSALAGLTKAAFATAAALAAAGKAAMAANVAKAVPTPAAFGQVFPFAFGGGIGSGMGGVGDSPTLFPMAGGMGLAFEAGAEAVLPLKRGPDGRLGVAGGGGGGDGGTVIVVNDHRGADAPPVETQESQSPDGKRMISLMIRSEQKSAIKEGAMDGAMRDTYGIPRQVARR